MFIGVWLIAKGFNSSAFASAPAKTAAIASDQVSLSQA
jgi:hypothetical protein